MNISTAKTVRQIVGGGEVKVNRNSLAQEAQISIQPVE